MSPLIIPLGSIDRVTQLFSYPNDPASSESLAHTVVHWFSQTLKNDGVNVMAAVEVDTEGFSLVLDGPDVRSAACSRYADRLPGFLLNGDAALQTVAQIKADGKWDPSPDGPTPPYRPWRFFLPLGMPMVNQRSLQFFHYPPIRLLEQTRDYLDDPVPVRCFELLEANGVAPGDLPLYNTVVDGAPIAAEDDQGSKKGGDPDFGWMPIQYFAAYQKAQVQLLLNPAPGHEGFTVPIVVYGAHPRQVFQKLFNVNLGASVNRRFVPHADVVEILPGLKTPVVGANHPYMFYAQAQISPTPGGSSVGSGHYASAGACQGSTGIMRGDLAISRWQKVMADDPSQSPMDVLNACTAYWNDPAQAAQVCALARHQASLFYSDPVSLAFRYNTSLTDAAAFCSTSNNNPCAGVSP